MSGHRFPPDPMDAGVLPSDASIDTLIRWTERKRASHPSHPLVDLIDAASLSPETLVELAAVDLIGQRRRGRDAIPEDYLKQFPKLAESDDLVLDLIDAELCVRRELKEPIDESSFSCRFPALADAIGQLVRLDLQPGATVPNTDDASVSPASPVMEADRGTADFADDSALDSEPFLLQRSLAAARGERRVSRRVADVDTKDSIDVAIPIKPPAWMVATRCLATWQSETGRVWLVRGRDKRTGESVAMKVLPLPPTLQQLDRTRILDLCETSSNVSHPSWVVPRIAAISRGRLAIIRPWIFGMPLTSNRPISEPAKRLGLLVRVAYALSAAHRIGATHGSVKAENIIIDHDGEANLVDVCSGVSAWEHSLATWNADLTVTRAPRVRRDTCALVSLIATECLESKRLSMPDWIGRITESVDFEDAEACASIGEALQSLLDHPPVKQRWWRK